MLLNICYCITSLIINNISYCNMLSYIQIYKHTIYYIHTIYIKNKFIVYRKNYTIFMRIINTRKLLLKMEILWDYLHYLRNALLLVIYNIYLNLYLYDWKNNLNICNYHIRFFPITQRDKLSYTIRHSSSVSVNFLFRARYIRHTFD